MRKSFSGDAAPTTLVGNITSTQMSFGVAGISGWPDTTVGPFVVTMDTGTDTEEKILCQSYSGTTVTVEQRGWDSTTPQEHQNGAPVAHTLDADTINQANEVVNGVGSVTPTTSKVGDSPSGGTSAYPAAADHTHGRENFAAGATQSLAFGGSSSDGTSSSPARADHVHGLPDGGSSDGGAATSWPIGAMGIWPGPAGTMPGGFLPLDGRSLSRMTYSALYTALGGGSSPYGQGDGSTTFQIPNMPVGGSPVQQGGSVELGQTGGQLGLTLTAAMIPELPLTIEASDSGHTHAVSDPGHIHAGAGGGDEFAILPPSSTLYVQSSGVQPITFTTNTDAAATGVSIAEASANISASGSAGSANPIQIPPPPFVAMNYMIRAF